MEPRSNRDTHTRESPQIPTQSAPDVSAAGGPVLGRMVLGVPGSTGRTQLQLERSTLPLRQPTQLELIDLPRCSGTAGSPR
eukprot:3026780-Prymnesium_polylepis.1